jgi:hypothetical protein
MHSNNERYGANISLQVQMVILISQDPVLVGLGSFTFLAGLLVFVFLASQLWDSLLYGRTGNESEKWGDLDHAIRTTGEVTEWPRELKEFNQNYGKKKRKGAKKVNYDDDAEEDDLVPLTSIKEIRNIYDRGVVGNLKQIMFPKRF